MTAIHDRPLRATPARPSAGVDWSTLPKLGINVQITNLHGWGVHAMELARRLMDRRIALPVQVLPQPIRLALPPDEGQFFAPLLAAHGEFERSAIAAGTEPRTFPTFHGGGNGPASQANHWSVKAIPEDTLCQVFELATLGPADADFLRQFKSVIAVSRWNAEVLRQFRPDVHYCPLGVDTTLFSPGPRDDRFGKGKFVVFSGGKAEFRKGQDLVLAAFKIFQQSHPDAVLVVAWHNTWPGTAKSLEHSPRGVGAPPLTSDGRLDYVAWATGFGIPAGSFVDLGQVSNRATGALLRAAHVALFPNRAEGGTNMVAMECLAAGVPTILSKNSGHEDLIADLPCIALERQTPIDGPGLDAWRESDVDEIVAALERCHERRDMVRDMGRRAAKIMRQSWTWGTRMDAQIAAMGLG